MSWSAQTIASEPRLAAAYKRLSDKLKEIFQLEHADLDFGIYRILKLRRAELEKFLDHELLPQVGTILSEHVGGAGGADADSDVLALAREVFSDLLTFFSRYYDEGDFMSLPRYGKDKYAIPYDGAEVKLHWANADQYYVKSTEYFADYLAVLEDGVQGLAKPRLRFKLVHAESDRDNNKASEKRRFVLREQDAVQVDGDTLTAWFEWKAVTKDEAGGKTTQEALNALSAEHILAAVKPGGPWHAVLTRVRAGSDKTHLAYQLWRYTKKNTSDYFIHKDLGGFLRRELDFYIKNEVLFLDDIEGRTAEQIDGALRKIKALRQVAHKLIDWLAQLEDFQKRLFKKVPFVLESEFIASVSSDFNELPQAMKAAAEERAMDLLGIASLKASSTHDPLDARAMTTARMYALKNEAARYAMQFRGSDSDVTGTLIQSDNHQALRLIERKFRGQFGGVFIDPPYNTGGDGFLYKDGYQRSSWLALMHQTSFKARELLSLHGTFWMTLDDREQARAIELLSAVFGGSNLVGVVAWQKKASPSNDSKWFSADHDYVTCFTTDINSYVLPRLGRTDEQSAYYSNPDNDPRGAWNSGTYTCGKTDIERPNLYYPITNPNTGEEIWPRRESVWRFTREKHAENVKSNLVYWGVDGTAKMPRIKKFLSEAGGVVARSVWPYAETGHTQEATTELQHMFGTQVFKNPKPTRLLERIGRLAIESDGLMLDYFAGSGTTGHAILNLNREDDGTRRFVLVEAGDHFQKVLLPRILKATYAREWKDGRPSNIEPLTANYRVLRLESYDDTLENIALTRTPDAQQLLDGDAALREQYTLRYMLDLESRGSLLNLTKFDRPWDYTIKVRKDGVVQDSPVDLVETFNYLLGLHVKRYDTFGKEHLLFVEGTVKTTTERDERVLVIWRDCTVWTHAALEPVLAKMLGTRSPDSRIYLEDYDTIYINGDHHIDLTKVGEDARLKVLPIEETFHARMFDTSDVD